MRSGRCAADPLRVEIARAKGSRASLPLRREVLPPKNPIAARRCLALFVDEMLHTAARRATNINRTSIVSQLPQLPD